MIRSRTLARWESILIAVLFVSVGLVILQVSLYDDNKISDVLSQVQNTVQPGDLLSSITGSEPKSKPKLGLSSTILLPAGYDFDDKVVRKHLNGTASHDWPIQRVKKENIIDVPPLSNSRFDKHEPFHLFHAAKAAEVHQCDTKLNITVSSLQISEREAVSGDFRKILEKVVEEHDIYHDPYYKDISPLFLKHLRVLLEKDMLHAFWFRLSGSSVWLKDHNVHLVVSRFMFDESRSRNHAKLSVALAQVFDRNWKELQDVRLVFPTNDLEESDPLLFKVNGQAFLSHRFPRIMPIPFHHDYGKTGDIYFGPEDPRIMLVRNKNGYDEPIIVFNADHVKMLTNKEGNEEKKRYRSMFMSYLFQRQVGKFVADDVNNPASDNIIYTRTIELSIPGVARPPKTKNWTPMVSDIQRFASGGYDEHILFVSRLENLEILKCDIINQPGTCLPIYSMKGDVGALRGGTPFVNLNQLIQEQTDIPLRQILPPGREVFFSVARAHLSQCGCGRSFYRPNLVIMTKDQATYTRSSGGQIEDVTEYFFKISHVSSSLSLRVPIDPWYVDRPYRFCENVNALIPNGISKWKVDSFENVAGRWTATDEMTLAISVSDYTVDVLNIRGVLDLILNTPDESLFLPPSLERPDSYAKMGLPSFDWDGALTSDLVGYTNTNIYCAMKKSVDFCRIYGEEQKKISDEHPEVDIEDTKSELDTKLKELEDALNNNNSDDKV